MVDLIKPLSDVRLLIVEDEVLIAIMVEEFAEELGCLSFHTAATVAEALSAIDSFKPQLALVDCSITHSGPDFVVADALDDRDIRSSSPAGTSPISCLEGTGAGISWLSHFRWINLARPSFDCAPGCTSSGRNSASLNLAGAWARPARAGYGLVCHFVGQCEKPEKSHCFPCRHVR